MSITERIRYGAAELKASYGRNLLLALLISITIHGAAIGLYLASSRPAEALPEARGLETRRDTLEVILDDGKDRVLPPIDPPKENDVRRPTDERGGTTAPPKAVPGANPLIVEDTVALIDDEFPTLDEIAHAGQKGEREGDIDGGGNGTDDGLGAASGSDPAGAPRGETAIDATSEFRDDVELPTLDMGELASKIVYPPIAREHDIEGTVYVKALIGLDGAVEQVEVTGSANRILDEAAIDAVRRTRFTEGRQNGVPVRVWVMIPIRFRLD